MFLYLQFKHRGVNGLCPVAFENSYYFIQNSHSQSHVLGSVVPRALWRFDDELVWRRIFISQLGFQLE